MKPVKKKIYTLCKASNTTGNTTGATDNSNIFAAVNSLVSSVKTKRTKKSMVQTALQKATSVIKNATGSSAAKSSGAVKHKKIYALRKASNSTNSDNLLALGGLAYEEGNAINNNTKTMSSLMIQLDSTKTIMVIIAIGIAAYVFMYKD